MHRRERDRGPARQRRLHRHPGNHHRATAYADLATTGPSVTATTSASAIVSIYCNQLSSNGNAAWMSYAISGATTDASNDNRAVQLQSTGGQRCGGTFFHSSILTPGTNTFKAEYRISSAGTATFSVRRLMVIPM